MGKRVPQAQRVMMRFFHLAMALLLLLLGLSLTACGGSDGTAVQRGPVSIEIDAKLNGLYWDAAQARLYITDDARNAIRSWSDEGGFALAAELPPMPEGQRPTLGQLVRGADGRLYTTRFGFGEYGTVVASTGAASVNLAGLDPTRRRIGIARAPDGALVTSWFRGGAAGGASGTISELTVQDNDAVERELVTGLNKPTGIAIVGDALFIADQGNGLIRRWSLSEVRNQAASAAEGDVVAEFAASEKLDLMTADDAGTLYIGSGAGNLYVIDSRGRVTTLATGWPGIRGLAWDGRANRLFAAVMATDATASATVRIVPLS